MVQATALEIIQQATAELGLPVPPTLPSSEVIVKQLVAMLNAAGAELVSFYGWSYLERVWSFVTVPAQTEYPLPKDWAYPCNNTAWNATDGSALNGPKTDAVWAYLENSGTMVPNGTRYRISRQKLVLHPAPVDPYTINFSYITNRWVESVGGSAKAVTDQPDDRLLHDKWLLVKYTKYKFLELKGLDAAASRSEFIALLSLLVGKDRGAPVLSLTPRSARMAVDGLVPEGSWSV